jgi:polysaccharide biosynthesis protein PelC
MKQIKYMLLALLAIAITGCATSAINISCSQIRLPRNANYGVMPFQNNTDRPQTGNRAAAITAGILQTMGPNNVTVYQPVTYKNEIIANPNKTISMRTQLAWAKRNNIRYILSGTVNEWRYKVGLDGEPAVNLTLKLYDTRMHRYIWNAVGSLTGGSRDGLGLIAQRLISGLLGYITLV